SPANGGTWLKASEGEQGGRRPCTRRIQRVNCPHCGRSARGKAESCRHDANDRMLLAVERKCAVQPLGIGAHMVSPELLTDHNNLGCAGTVLLGTKSSSFERRNAKDREEVRA